MGQPAFDSSPSSSLSLALGAVASTEPIESIESIVGPEEQLLLLVVGGPPRVVEFIERSLASRIGVAMAVVSAKHSDDALKRLANGFDGVVVFDDLAGRATLRGLAGLARRVPSVCIVERSVVGERAQLRAQMRHEGAKAVLFAEELNVALLEMAVLHAVEFVRAQSMVRAAPALDVGIGKPEFLRRVRAASNRQGVEHDFRFRVAHVEIDALRHLDGELGQAIESELLERLRDGLPPRSWLRLTPGSYAMLFEDEHGADDLEQLEFVRETLQRPFRVDGEVYSLQAGFGVVRGDERTPPQILLDRAEIAAKTGAPESEVDAAELSGTHHRGEALAAERIESSLRQGLERGEFSLAFQPIVHLDRPQHLVGFEALIRWSSDGRERAAAEFIPQAERTDLMVPLGYWALEAAIRQMTEWERDFELGGKVALSVNLSASQCADPTLLARIQSLLMTTGLDPAALRIEIGEDAVVTHRAATRSLIDGLAAAGVGVWIEDFGLGECTIDDLKGLPIAALKVDRTLVAGLDGTSATTGRIKHVAHAAAALKVSVLAEGVENQLQANVLRWLGIEVGQGYLFAKPMPVGDAFALLARGA